MHVNTRLYEAILILSFIALWLSGQLVDTAEYIVGYFLILTIGVGHGANDLKIYFKDQQLGLKKMVSFISIYVLIVLLGFAAFFVIPDVVLLLFILVSGFHFGQEHYERFQLPRSLVKTIFETAYGSLIIITLLHVNSASSLPIIHDLINFKITAALLEWAVYIFAAATVVTGIIVLKSLSWSLILREFLYLAVLFIIFSSSSLVWGFAIYFILWHSVPSINHQVHHLKGTVNKRNIMLYIKESLLYWIAALLFLGVLYYFLSERTTLFLSIIVAFLGGITFPHVIVMHKIHK